MASPRWVPPAGTERVFALIVLTLAVTAWCTLTLAEFGAFTTPRLWSISVPLVVASAWLIWREEPRRPADATPVPRRHVFAALACVLATATLTSRPADSLINGSDASVYLNIASAIERRGGINVAEPLLAHLDQEAREALFDRDAERPHLLNFFPGGIQIAADGRRLQPNFFHLAPAAIAGVSALTGSPATGLLVLPLAGLLTMAAVWLLAVRVASPLAATTAVLLLTLNFAQIWFSRFPASEGVTACFLLSGLWLTVRSARDGSVASGLLGGAAFGLAACSRLEVLLLVSPLVAGYLGLVALRGQWTRAQTCLAVSFCLLTSQAVLHAVFVTTPYTERILWQVFATDWWLGRTTLLVPAAATAAAVLAWLAWRFRRRAVALGTTPVVRVFVALALVAAIVRALPALFEGPAAVLFTPVGLVAMASGAVWLALDDPEPEVLLLVAVFLASALVYVDAPRAGRWYPLPWRRYVPVVLPVGMLLVGHVTAVLWRQRAPWRWSAALLVGFLAIHSGRQSQLLATAAPMADLRDNIARIAARVPTGTVLVTDSTLPSHLGLSLHFTFEQPVLVTRHRPGASAALERLFHSLARSGWSLAIATAPHAAPGSLTRAAFAGLDLLPLTTVPLRWSELELAAGVVPARLRTETANIELYTVRASQPASLPLAIDIGASDLRWRLDGFHGPEFLGGAGVRWTSASARVFVPQLAAGGAVRLRIRMAAPRPAGWPAARATLLLDDDVILESPDLTGDLQDISFTLDQPVIDRLTAGATTLTLRTTPFIPRAEGGGGDSRELGLIVDGLRFEAP